MRLVSLHLRHFRNYEDEKISFHPKVNWITGMNASGKTNLLEAIYFLATGRSFRTNHPEDLIQKGASYFYLQASFHKEHITQSVQVYFDKNQSWVKHHQQIYPKFRKLLGFLPSVLYVPEDIGLIDGVPALRRRFLNLHLAQYDPLYVHHLLRYQRSLKQRNHLLKKQQEQTLDIWDHTLAESGSYLLQKRHFALNRLTEEMADWTPNLAPFEEKIHLGYSSSLSSFEAYLEQLQRSRKKDLFLKSTQIGPHRDDFYFAMKSDPAKRFASEGQKRTCLLALKFAQWTQLQNHLGYPPLLCFDDVDMHLDQERKDLLSRQMDRFEQVFITSPYSPQRENCHPLVVEKGRFITA